MRVPHLPSACLAVRAGPHDRPPPGRPDLPVQPVSGVRPSPSPQAPAELAARPAPAGRSYLDHPGPADAHRDLRALPGLSDLPVPPDPSRLRARPDLSRRISGAVAVSARGGPSGSA